MKARWNKQTLGGGGGLLTSVYHRLFVKTEKNVAAHIYSSTNCYCLRNDTLLMSNRRRHLPQILQHIVLFCVCVACTSATHVFLQCSDDDNGWRVSTRRCVIHEQCESVATPTGKAGVIKPYFPGCVSHNAHVSKLMLKQLSGGTKKHSGGRYCISSLLHGK